MERIRLGIVGCGGMGKAHLAGMSEITDLADITCACDIIEERAREAAKTLAETAGHEVLVFTDYKDMVEHVDAVTLVLPHHLHYEVSMFFARRGKHILVEKPMCNTEEECVNLIEACESTPAADGRGHVTLMCAYPVRYWPEIIKLKELVDSGEFGELFNMSIWTEQYTNYTGNKEWPMRAKNLGGGQFFSHGCHYVDILLWFLGKPVEGAHIGTNHGTPWMEREGTSNAIMKFENGAMGYHFGTWGARGTEHGYCFQLHMTKGMLDYHRASGKIVLYQNCNPDLPAEMPPEDKVRVLWEDPDRTKKTQFETRHFLECVKTGKRPDTDGRRSVQSLRCIWRMYDAEQKGVMADLRGLGLDE
ncbi:MAG: Gfo/Idh/MocA family oxidoreductase [Clostridiales bacterium]|jgi:predicted dehydrogenase|nr:Gfo/Idh/MocA family oxidoreductase [Clostridiales bacterium]